MFGVGTERPSRWVDDGHLREAEHHRESDKAGNRVAQQHRRPGVANGNTAAHKQSSADGAAEPDHDDLRLAQLLAQADLALGVRTTGCARAQTTHLSMTWSRSMASRSCSGERQQHSLRKPSEADPNSAPG